MKRNPCEMKKEYYFKEGCYIIEYHNDPSDPNVSLARARVKPGVSTEWHSLIGTCERYLILDGSGMAEKGSQAPQEVKPGETFIIPAGMAQRITNNGSVDLVFLAVCTPRFEEKNYQSE